MNSSVLQNDLVKLQGWSETWNLHFNASKCKVLHIGKNNPEMTYTMTSNNQNQDIAKCQDEKDLGVVFDNKLLFDAHIDGAINKASRNLGVIKRTFSYLDKDMFLQLYKALVRPHLEYGNVIWYPILKRQSAAIEKVQRRATKLLKNLKHLTYRERLQTLNLPSLKSRRIRGDLIQAYKIFNHIDDLDFNLFFKLSSVSTTRNADFKIYIEFNRTNKRKHCFSQRVAPLWNALPNYIKTAPNTNTFKNLIDQNKIVQDTIYDYDE